MKHRRTLVLSFIMAVPPALGATVTINPVKDNTVYQGGLTYTSHPISLAAAIANIQVMRGRIPRVVFFVGSPCVVVPRVMYGRCRSAHHD